MKQVTFNTQTRGLGAVYNAGDIAVFDDRTADEIVAKQLGTAKAFGDADTVPVIAPTGVGSAIQAGVTGGTAPHEPQGVAATPEEVGTSGPGPARPGVDEPGTPVPETGRARQTARATA